MLFRNHPSHKPRLSTRLARLTAALEREGARAFALRKLSQLSASLAERSRIRRMHRVPWLKDDRAVFLLITHRCGGGTERHLGDLERALRGDGIRPLVVRPGQSGSLLWEERGDGPGASWCRESNTDPESIAKMLAMTSPAHVHVHHALGLPEALFDAVDDRGIPYDVTIHDYHTICPRINLHQFRRPILR